MHPSLRRCNVLGLVIWISSFPLFVYSSLWCHPARIAWRSRFEHYYLPRSFITFYVISNIMIIKPWVNRNFFKPILTLTCCAEFLVKESNSLREKTFVPRAFYVLFVCAENTKWVEASRTNLASTWQLASSELLLWWWQPWWWWASKSPWLSEFQPTSRWEGRSAGGFQSMPPSTMIGNRATYPTSPATLLVPL